MTHCTSTMFAWNAFCSVGMATLTTVLSMKAILEARIVAVRIHGPASGLHGAAALPDRMGVPSQGVRMAPMGCAYLMIRCDLRCAASSEWGSTESDWSNH